jgi:virginiamycin B lyase
MNLVRFSRKIPTLVFLVFLATIVGVGPSTAQVLPLSITKYPVNDYIPSITAGPDGALWFTENFTGKVGRITTDGAITSYFSPVGCPFNIVPGPDGALWVTGCNQIGRVTPSGLTTVYGLPTPNSNPAGIAAGSDGALWFTEAGAYKIGRITTDGEVTEFPLPSSGRGPVGITAGPDGAMWFTECCDKNIGRITPEGLITEYPLPASSDGGGRWRIVAGPDGALWFNEFSGKIGRITTDGAVTEYSIPIPDAGPFALAVGPDGALWFPIGSHSQDYLVGTIGRITTDGDVTFYNAPDDFVAVAAGPDGAMWFTSGTCDPDSGCRDLSIVRAVPGSGLTVDTLFLPGGVIGTAYSASLTANGGTAPYTWSVSAGSLPTGLTLDPATGAISGTPSGPGMSFTTGVTDIEDAYQPFLLKPELCTQRAFRTRAALS